MSPSFPENPTLGNAFRHCRCAVAEKIYKTSTIVFPESLYNHVKNQVLECLIEAEEAINMFPVLYRSREAQECSDLPPCFDERLPRIIDNIRQVRLILRGSHPDTVILKVFLQFLSIQISCLGTFGASDDERALRAVNLTKDYALEIHRNNEMGRFEDLDPHQLRLTRQFWDHMQMKKVNCSCPLCEK